MCEAFVGHFSRLWRLDHKTHRYLPREVGAQRGRSELIQLGLHIGVNVVELHVATASAAFTKNAFARRMEAYQLQCLTSSGLSLEGVFEHCFHNVELESTGLPLEGVFAHCSHNVELELAGLPLEGVFSHRCFDEEVDWARLLSGVVHSTLHCLFEVEAG
jgi:hypothetical protein